MYKRHPCSVCGSSCRRCGYSCDGDDSVKALKRKHGVFKKKQPSNESTTLEQELLKKPIYTLKTNVPLNEAFQRLNIPSYMKASNKISNEYAINDKDTIDLGDSTKNTDNIIHPNSDTISACTEEPCNEVMRKNLSQQNTINLGDYIMNDEDNVIDTNSDTIPIGTEEPLNQVMARKRTISRYHNSALLRKRPRRNNYCADYDATVIKYSVNTSIKSFQ